MTCPGCGAPDDQGCRKGCPELATALPKGMVFTEDELVVIIESLREYRLRVADGSRILLCDALIFRFGQQLVSEATTRVRGTQHGQQP